MTWIFRYGFLLLNIHSFHSEKPNKVTQKTTMILFAKYVTGIKRLHNPAVNFDHRRVFCASQYFILCIFLPAQMLWNWFGNSCLPTGLLEVSLKSVKPCRKHFLTWRNYILCYFYSILRDAKTNKLELEEKYLRKNWLRCFACGF